MFRKKTRQTPSLPEYPQGTFLKTEKGYFFVVSDAKRYRFLTLRVLESWAPHRVVETSESDPAVARLRIAAKMRFRNGSLLYSQSDGKMYLVSDSRLRHIKNPDWLPHLGLTKKSAVWVSESEINLHEIGEPLN